jgi:uncharacterized protein YoxC
MGCTRVGTQYYLYYWYRCDIFCTGFRCNGLIFHKIGERWLTKAVDFAFKFGTLGTMEQAKTRIKKLRLRNDDVCAKYLNTKAVLKTGPDAQPELVLDYEQCYGLLPFINRNAAAEVYTELAQLKTKLDAGNMEVVAQVMENATSTSAEAQIARGAECNADMVRATPQNVGMVAAEALAMLKAEVFATVAEMMDLRYGLLDSKFNARMEAFGGEVQAIDGKVQSIGSEVQAIDGKVQSIGSEVQTIDGKVQKVNEGLEEVCSTFNNGLADQNTKLENMQGFQKNMQLFQKTMNNQIQERLCGIAEHMQQAPPAPTPPAPAAPAGEDDPVKLAQVEKIRLEMDLMRQESEARKQESEARKRKTETETDVIKNRRRRLPPSTNNLDIRTMLLQPPPRDDDDSDIGGGDRGMLLG